MEKKYIEAMTVCVHYDDFLNYTLPLNKDLFDKWIIITAPDDRRTQSICAKHHVQSIASKRIHENNAIFNKGKALNDGLRFLEKKEWLLQIDADIILPHNFREIIDIMPLHLDYMYGSLRKEPTTLNLSEISNLNRVTPEQIHLWEDTTGGKGRPSISAETRWLYREMPMGYFQMFTMQPFMNQYLIFPEVYETAGGYDDEFAYNYWINNKTELLQGITVIHLPHGMETTNWKGRVSNSLSSLIKMV